MDFLSKLRLFFRGKEQVDDDMPSSVVMLFRSPFLMSKEVLERAASKAYGNPYDGSNEMYFVVKTPVMTIVKADGVLISVLEVPEHYLGDPVEVAQGFKDQRLQDAWKQHHTWCAFDLMNPDMSKKQAYRSIAPLVAELLDTRCAGIYLPKENQFTLQSDGSATKHLASLSK